MPTLVLKDAMFQVNAVDLSPHVTEVAINYSAEMLDETAMGDTTRIRKGGLLSWTITPKFNQDFAAGAVDATLFSLVGTTACVAVRAVNSCASATNPIYNGIAVLESYPPFGGGVGTLAGATATFQSAGVLARQTTSTV